jgi:GT2 family glycosyltransferase
MSDKKISIIIPVYNNWGFTKSVLSFLLKNNSDVFEVVIIDNGSVDRTSEEIKPFQLFMSNLIYLRNDKNLGFGAAVNRGFNESNYDNILFLNNDVLFACKDLEWLNNLINSIDDNSFIGPTAGFLNENFEFKYETDDFSKPINYMSGWFLCASRKLLNKLSKGLNGPFDDKTFFAYFEDADLSFRAKKIGVNFVHYNAPMHHIGKQTSKKIGLSNLYIKSKEQFIKKWKI